MNQYVFEEERPVVDTKCGKIRGIAYGGVNIFMGIDYAKAKRFQMPVEIEPWEGIKNAYQHGPISKQVLKLKPFYTYRGLHMLEEESEDCQNLNIWAPKVEQRKNRYLYGFMEADSSEETHLKNIPLKERTLQDMEILFLFQSTTD